MIVQYKSDRNASKSQTHPCLSSASLSGESPDLARPLGIVSGKVTLPGEAPTPVSCEMRKGAVEGLIDLITEAPTALAKRVTELGTALSALFHHHGAKLTGIGFALAPAAAAPAALMLDVPAGMTYQEHRQTYIDHSDPYFGRVFSIAATGSDGSTIHGTGIRINQRKGLTNAHLFELNGISYSNHTYSFTENYLTQPGTHQGQIADFGVYPGWNSTWQAADLAWIEFDQDVINGAPDVTIGTVAIGDIVTTVGYGRPGTPQLGLLAADGNLDAFDAMVTQFGSSGISPIYAQLTFDNFFPLSPIEGAGAPGNSGSGGFDPNTGELLTIHAGGIGVPGQFARSLQLNVGLEPYRTWSNTNTAVPEPNGVAILLAGGTVCMIRVRQRNAVAQNE